MRDSDVRAAVTRWLHATFAHDPFTRIVEEMGIWSGSVRIDIAVINGELHGFELKSECDTLARLAHQAELYNQVFDRMTLVTAKRHLDKARSKIPSWWGITIAHFGSSESVALKPIKKSSRNKNTDPVQLARLLWRPEILTILQRRGLSRGYKSKTVEVLTTRLAEVLTISELSAEVRATLKYRNGWLGKPVSDERQVSVGSIAGPLFSAASRTSVGGDLLNDIVSPTAD